MPPEEISNAAVLVRGAHKTYGTGASAKIVFDNLNMTVPRGSIYGLLGASGCGKTTLLSCVVGIKELNAGDVWVLGGKPGTPGSGVPGPRVGFMPQDISLISEFSVKGAVYYFGRIFELSDSQLAQRFAFLSNLLDLPPPDRYIKNCSGGQQRRVSLAAALVHEPELLILDEPTVGLDPVLRDRIWNHLVDITVRDNVAVIITTHYIEETKQAHNIGLMRGGQLMAEESPERLISIFNVESLEDAFLILSERQTRGEPVPEFETLEYKEGRRKREEKYASRVISQDVTPTTGSTFALVSSNESKNDEKIKRPLKKYKTYSSRRLKALLVKNTHQIIRNYSGLVFTFFFPIVEMLSFFLGVGSNPKGMKLGIVNYESTWQNCSNYTKLYPTVTYDEVNDICEFSMLSCRFLDKLNDTIAEKVYFDDTEKARECVLRGDCLGYLKFASNFSDAAMARQEDGRFTSNEDLDASEIQISMDMSNRQLSTIMKQQLYDLYFEYVQDLLPNCNMSKKAGVIPIHFEQPVYGNLDDEYLIFMYPAVLTTLIFYMGTSITSTSIVVDRLEGVWDRSLVSGVTHGEILLTHFCSQFILVFIQVVEMLFITYVCFDMQLNGSFILTFSLLLCQGINGMLNGFLISISCGTISLANIVVTGSFFLIVLLCGLLWPLEGMPTFLRLISQCMPFTLPINSVRSVVIKGLTLTSASVWFGLVVSVIWMTIYSVLSYVILKKKS